MKEKHQSLIKKINKKIQSLNFEIFLLTIKVSVYILWLWWYVADNMVTASQKEWNFFLALKRNTRLP